MCSQIQHGQVWSNLCEMQLGAVPEDPCICRITQTLGNFVRGCTFVKLFIFKVHASHLFRRIVKIWGIFEVRSPYFAKWARTTGKLCFKNFIKELLNKNAQRRHLTTSTMNQLLRLTFHYRAISKKLVGNVGDKLKLCPKNKSESADVSSNRSDKMD